MEKSSGVIWCLGKTVLVCWILACLGAIIFWLRVEKSGAVFEITSWSKVVKERLMMTYCHLSSSYLLNCFSVAYVLSSNKLFDIMTFYIRYIILGEVFLMSGLTTFLEYIPFSQETNILKNSIWVLHSTCLGLPIAYLGSHVCTLSALGTALLLFLALVVAYTAPKDFYKTLTNHTSNLYFTITICSLASIFNIPPVTPTALLILTINIFGGIILYFTVFIINLQYVLREAEVCREFDPVYSSAVIYLCTINLYVRLCLYYFVEKSSGLIHIQ